MKIIINYIGWNLLKGILLTLVLLLGIDLFFYFVNEVRSIGIGNYNLLKALEFLVFSIPRKLYNISPWAVLIGSLITLGSMAKTQELLFIRSIGISVNQIALYGGIYILFFTICIFIIGEFLAPKIEIFAQKKKTIALSKGNAIYTVSGIWTRKDNKFIHVATIVDQNTLNNITIYEFDSNLYLKKSIFAQTAKFIEDKNCKCIVECNKWEIKDIIITEFINLLNIDNNIDNVNLVSPSPQVIKTKLATMQINDLLDLNILRASNAKNLNRLSINSLFLIIKNRTANNLTVIDYNIIYWKKIIQPFSILIMGYLAVPFVLGPLRSASKGTRLLVGIVIGVIFYLLNALFAPLSTVFHLSPVIAAILPPIIFLCCGIYLSLKT